VDLLVLGGTRFVGRVIVAEALTRGWQVSALNRGITGSLPTAVTLLRADRRDAEQLRTALAGRAFDAVIDTWSGAPMVATTAAAALVGSAERYAYVSSSSVYAWGAHRDEDSPLVDGDASAIDGDYPALKRGAELGVVASFPEAVVARAGLILGPYEDIGRLPWWLARIADGGPVVAPGRPRRPLQYIDVRDLTNWILHALTTGLQGPIDVISRSGHATTEKLLTACKDATGSDAEFRWVSETDLAAAGVQPWTQLPCWVPEAGEFAGFLEADTSRAAATGLACRPIEETVAATWSWLQAEGWPAQRDDRPTHGLPVDLERTLLAHASRRRGD
jgi:nucleoside-diphosphate-sugar epimerase